jgi:rRNA-processing protein FCF1
MMPGMFGVDIKGELERLLDRRVEFLIPGPVLRELKDISVRGTPDEKSAARVGLIMAEHGSVIEFDAGADESIIKIALEKRCPVGTNDSSLRKRLRKEGIPVIYLRGRSHLSMDGQIE